MKVYDESNARKVVDEAKEKVVQENLPKLVRKLQFRKIFKSESLKLDKW